MPAKKNGKGKRPKARVTGVLGVGLDATDGHKRITRTEEMVLVGGSQETHERMQETAIKFSEELGKAGKKLPDLTPKQAAEMLHEAIEKTGR
jgi:hypothetical protein